MSRRIRKPEEGERNGSVGEDGSGVENKSRIICGSFIVFVVDELSGREEGRKKKMLSISELEEIFSVFRNG